MRCPKCGKFNWGYVKVCKKCGADFSIPRNKKHHRLLWIIIIFVLCLIAGFIFLGVSMDNKFNDAVADIQANLADVAAAKSGGDSIMAGRKVETTMDSIQTTAITAAKKLAELTVLDELKNYQAVAISWSIKVAAAAAQPANWRNLKNQPDDFPLAITDAKVSNIFKPLVQNLADFKKSGAEAIQNKDRQAMFKIGVKILVQNHWLNALLYSQKEYKTSSLAASASAVSQDLQVPQVGQGVDVTCSVCDYPDAYKVRWTDELRRQYGCDTRCHPKTTSKEGQTATNDAATNDAAINDAKKYADSLAAYNYDNATKRAICIGNNVGGVFCVEEAVQSTNEIAASAMGFADNTKALTVDEWNNEYEDIDLAVLPAGTTGESPSQPSAEGGHQEGGMGTVSTGESDKAPIPSKSLDGHYTGHTSYCNCIMRGTDKYNPCTDNLNHVFSFDVSNNAIRWPVTEGYDFGTTNINSSGVASYSIVDGGYRSNFTFHFYGTDNGGVAFNGTGASNNYYRSEAIHSINMPEYIDDTSCQYKYTGTKISD